MAANEERVVTTWLQQIVRLFQKAAQGLPNEGPPHRGLHLEFPGPKAPAELPNPTVGIDFPLNCAVLPGVAGDVDMGRGLGQSTHGWIPSGAL